MTRFKVIDGGATRENNAKPQHHRPEGPRALTAVAESAAQRALEADASTIEERVLPSNSAPTQGSEQTASAGGGQPSPSLPQMPGPIPVELTRALRNGEAVLWWGRKSAIDPRPILVLAAGGLVLLGLFSVLVPELWSRPWERLWQPLAIVLAPAAAAVVRERANMRALVITDIALIDVDSSGRTDRLSLRNVTRVRRDVWTGGIRLDNEHHTVRIAASMVQDAHAVVRSILRNTVRASATTIDDPMRWLE